MKNKEDHSKTGVKNVLLLTVAALGVVYGDIGTSPLYAINEIFFGQGRLSVTPNHILGSISLVFWALAIIVSFKYVLIVLEANYNGEGGVFALSALLDKLNTKRTKVFALVSSLLIFAAGLLFGDGIITPAISVLSAVEGLGVIAPSLQNFIVPITIGILTVLFLIQRKGTSKVGTVFGPIIVAWFLVIGVLGGIQIIHHPDILQAINPIYGIRLILENNVWSTFLVIGAIMLTMTGGEAMYADMGHFGKTPIRLGWFTLAYPALLLNYFGQGAFVLHNEVLGGNIFYSMVPFWGRLPMIILATMATVIASQALISGAFSLATQAIELNLLPRLKIIHTHHHHEGQKYVPFINWALYVGCVLLVVSFGSSTRLASAYGLAVSGVMVITSIAMFGISRYLWKWNKLKVVLLFGPLTAISFGLLAASSIKIVEGGYIPLTIGLVILVIMSNWKWGRKKTNEGFKNYPTMTVKQLLAENRKHSYVLPKSIIVMTPNAPTSLDSHISPVAQMLLERYGTLPNNLLFLTVTVEHSPHIEENRFEIKNFYSNKERCSIVSVKMKFGFMEELNVEEMLEQLAKEDQIDIEEDSKDWVVHIAQERLHASSKLSIFRMFELSLYRFLQKNSDTTDHFFGLGQKIGLSAEVVPMTIK